MWLVICMERGVACKSGQCWHDNPSVLVSGGIMAKWRYYGIMGGIVCVM